MFQLIFPTCNCLRIDQLRIPSERIKASVRVIGGSHNMHIGVIIGFRVSNWDDKKVDVAVALAVATRIKIRARPFVSEFRLVGSEWRMETQRSAYLVVLQVVWIKPALRW
ncbi:hypothetical protein GOBAR_AA00162 [Gossypium barbadense]|uniref:Uncharacterized protein n=1 Tax=Gossypium barbadense TaxID=3634 RepID=A0A2P5YXY9_GOSBA|nr:hypothetical protein GOBAR_AA00162 [Gossypium barbadense]